MEKVPEIRYLRCFPVYPLPTQFHPELAQRLKLLQKLMPDIKIGNLRMPHISLGSFKEMDKENWLDTRGAFYSNSRELLGHNLVISGVGTFKDQNTGRIKGVYINVNHEQSLLSAQAVFRHSFGNYLDLDDYSDDIGLHLTALMVPNQFQQDIAEHEPIWREMLEPINWSFTTNRVAVFGQDRLKGKFTKSLARYPDETLYRLLQPDRLLEVAPEETLLVTAA